MKKVHKVAVLGSGVMGSALACHLANAGFEVLMLDILPRDESLDRNHVAKTALQQAIKSKPSPLYTGRFQNRIHLGNFEDDLPKISECQWILEAIIERLDIKQQLYQKVEEYRTPGSIVTTNTSGIPIHMLAEGRSEDFRKHFCGSHFFNPPRYLRLLEIIPGQDTEQKILDTLHHIGSRLLGKKVVLCKDTPAFIANRIGVYAMSKTMELTAHLGLDIFTADKLTGPAIGRPSTGTFRLADLVGLDVAAKVTQGIQENCPQDQMAQEIESNKTIDFLLQHNFLGNKTGQGFYQKTDQRDDKGRRVILGIDLSDQTYKPRQRQDLNSLKAIKLVDDIPQRIRSIWKENDLGADLVRQSLTYLFAYASQRVPEVADDIHQIDAALKAGFGWDYGPFEYWDIIGLDTGIEAIQGLGLEVPEWINTMKASGIDRFYQQEGNSRLYYDLRSTAMQEIPADDNEISLQLYKSTSPVFSNEETQLWDIGDGVLCLEFTSKMNAIGEGVLRGIQESIRIAEEQGWKGLVIANDAKNFTVGANLMLLGMMAFQQQWDQIDEAVRLFQSTSMRCRYSDVPVVAATQGYVFGGGCEIAMHCDAVVASAESYIGLVEAGVGLIPGGAGTKEFALRAAQDFQKDTLQIPSLIERFKTIAMAQVATSAYEAMDHGYLDPLKDYISINLDHRTGKAKDLVLQLSRDYLRPIRRSDIEVTGRAGLATLLTAAHGLQRGGYASEHDILIAKKMAYVLTGGDLSGSQKVSEDYLLELEREAFVSLCGEPKTLERIQYMLENNKPLRN